MIALCLRGRSETYNMTGRQLYRSGRYFPGRPLSLEEEVSMRLNQKQAHSLAVVSDCNYFRVVVGYKRMLGETAASVSKPRYESRT
eukprot:g52779.t1